MKKVIWLGLFVVLLCFNLSQAKPCNKRFGLSAILLQTVPTNESLRAASGGGKTGYDVGFDICLKKGNIRPSVGIAVFQSPLEGKRLNFDRENSSVAQVTYYTGNWRIWTVGAYTRVLFENDLFSPFLEVGVGLYHLNLDYSVPWETKSISSNSFGYNTGGGLKISAGQFPVSLFGKINYHQILISKPINLLPRVNSIGYVSYGAGLSVTF
jgi:opacity protein-like surface antigen